MKSKLRYVFFIDKDKQRKMKILLILRTTDTQLYTLLKIRLKIAVEILHMTKHIICNICNEFCKNRANIL